MAIKEILKEELCTSLRMKKDYERELAKLPRGSLVRRKLKGRFYWYLVFREEGKFRALYRGTPGEGEIRKYQDAKKYRAIYRKLMAKLNRQIRFLQSAVRRKGYF